MGDYARTRKSIRNSLVAVSIQILSLLVGFWSRKLFLDYLGTEVLGLNTTAAGILGFLNLAELGIGSAIAVTLYKPLFDGDRGAVREIIALQGWLYRRVAFVIMGAAAILLPFLPMIFGKSDLPSWYAYASFLVLLFGALLGYFVNYRQAILAADQKEYGIQISYRAIMILKVAAQMLGVRYFENPYIWWLAFEVLFAIIAALALNATVNRSYPYLKEKCEVDRMMLQRYPGVVTKVKQLFVHKIGFFTTVETIPVFIYAYTSLTDVAVYGNYMILVNSLQAVLVAVFTGITASIGNMLAEGDRNLIIKVFREIYSARFLMVAFCCFALWHLAEPFVSLWIGDVYIIRDKMTLALIIAIFFLFSMRMVVDAYINAYGLFRDIWAPVAEVALFVAAAVVLGSSFGLNGVLAAQIIDHILIMFIWKPFFLFRYGIGHSVGLFYALFFKTVAAGAVSALSVTMLAKALPVDPASGFLQFAIYGAIICIAFALVLFGILYVSEKGMRTFVERMSKTVAKR